MVNSYLLSPGQLYRDLGYTTPDTLGSVNCNKRHIFQPMDAYGPLHHFKRPSRYQLVNLVTYRQSLLRGAADDHAYLFASDKARLG